MSYKRVNFLSTEEIDVIRQLFDLFDQNGEGKIQFQDLVKELRRFNFHTENPTIYTLIADVGANIKEKINFDTFMDLIDNKFYSKNIKSDLKNLFNMYSSGKDAISLKTLKELSKEIGDKISDSEWNEIIKNTSHSEKDLSFDDFYTLMVKGESLNKK